MKIGILTYHKSHNYGALLQAVALRYQLCKMGHEVFFIDYWPKYHSSMYSFFSINYALSHGLKSSIAYFTNFIFCFNKRKKRIESFNNFINTNIIPYCKEYSNKEEYDAIIYGSDQIWRKQRGLKNQFNPVYFAKNLIKTKRNIAYAASMGQLDLFEKDYKFLKSTLVNFNKIAVRETSLQTILQKININAPLVLDPTLLFSKNDWENIYKLNKPCNHKYVFYYRLQKNAFNEKNIYDFAKNRGCKVIILDGAAKLNTNNALSSANPIEFLSLIKYAEFIFTSSYHGLVFSLIFNKEFVTSFTTNADRANSLLTNISLQERLLTPHSEIPCSYKKIDYVKVNNLFESLRKSSIDYLDNL